MATEQDMTPRQVTPRRAPGRRLPLAGRLSARTGELIAYAVIWVALALFLWSRISAVDGFYLDEWIYIHGAEYIWAHLPSGLIGGIPGWDRGPQRLYSTMLAPFWGTLSTSRRLHGRPMSSTSCCSRARWRRPRSSPGARSRIRRSVCWRSPLRSRPRG